MALLIKHGASPTAVELLADTRIGNAPMVQSILHANRNRARGTKLSENLLIVLEDIDEGGVFNPHWRFGAPAKRMHGSVNADG